MNPNQPTTQPQRLPSFRNFNIQKIISNRILSKKTYVPNLDVSRKTHFPNLDVPRKVSAPVEKSEPREEVTVKKEETQPRRRNERKPNVIQTEGIFSSGIAKSTTGSRSGNVPYSVSSKVKQLKRIVEKLDDERKHNREKDTFKHMIDRQVDDIEKRLHISVSDLPVAVPRKTVKIEKEDFKIHSLIANILNPSDGESPLFLLKTPMYIPAVLDDSENPKINEKHDESSEKGFKCTVHDLPEGQIGKLQVMKSGKLRLVLGECKFWLVRGVKVNFKEELAVIRINDAAETGEIINLGEIQDRILAVPDNMIGLIKNI